MVRRLSAWPRCGKAVGCLKSLTPKYDRPKESDMRADKQNDNVSRLSQVIPVCLRSECFAFCEIPSVSGHFPFDSALTDLLTDLSTDGLTDFGNPGGAQGCLLLGPPEVLCGFPIKCAEWRGEPKLHVRIAYHIHTWVVSQIVYRIIYVSYINICRNLNKQWSRREV